MPKSGLGDLASWLSNLASFFQDGFFVGSFVWPRDIRVALVGMESALVCTTYECDRCRGAIVCMRDCQKVGKVLIFTRKSGPARFSTPLSQFEHFRTSFVLWVMVKSLEIKDQNWAASVNESSWPYRILLKTEFNFLWLHPKPRSHQSKFSKERETRFWSDRKIRINCLPIDESWLHSAHARYLQ